MKILSRSFGRRIGALSLAVMASAITHAEPPVNCDVALYFITDTGNSAIRIESPSGATATWSFAEFDDENVVPYAVLAESDADELAFYLDESRVAPGEGTPIELTAEPSVSVWDTRPTRVSISQEVPYTVGEGDAERTEYVEVGLVQSFLVKQLEGGIYETSVTLHSSALLGRDETAKPILDEFNAAFTVPIRPSDVLVCLYPSKEGEGHILFTMEIAAATLPADQPIKLEAIVLSLTPGYRGPLFPHGLGLIETDSQPGLTLNNEGGIDPFEIASSSAAQPNGVIDPFGIGAKVLTRPSLITTSGQSASMVVQDAVEYFANAGGDIFELHHVASESLNIEATPTLLEDNRIGTKMAVAIRWVKSREQLPGTSLAAGAPVFDEVSTNANVILEDGSVASWLVPLEGEGNVAVFVKASLPKN